MEDKNYKVQGNQSFVKNPLRGTVVNTNTSVYRARRAKLENEDAIQTRMTKLENDVVDIKSLLKQIVGKL